MPSAVSILGTVFFSVLTYTPTFPQSSSLLDKVPVALSGSIEGL